VLIPYRTLCDEAERDGHCRDRRCIDADAVPVVSTIKECRRHGTERYNGSDTGFLLAP
jgi:hypothetical protein